jgi:lipid-A-disaccharide synthase
MSDAHPTIFLSAAEASGDEHAAKLITALRRRLPEARFVGIGGEKMAAAGCEILLDLTVKAQMLGGPFLKAYYWWRTIRRIQRWIREIRPDLHIPVDSPALNWHLAKAAKQAGATVVYYIAPQVWAWATWRVRKLARLTDHVACILPFEQRYLRHRNVEATFIGHPLFDDMPDRPEALPDLIDAWTNGTWRVALLQGSRPGEIRGHTPALVAVANEIRRRFPKAQCTFTARTAPCADMIRKAAGDAEVDVAVARTREVLADSHFAVAVSGTVTLEVAHFGVPMVIFYRASRLGYHLIARWFIRTKLFSLVNILAGRAIVPELTPWFGNARKVTTAVLELMSDPGALVDARADLLSIADQLHAPPPQTASDNAAALICNVLGSA